MGLVYEAEQESLKRRVALKVLNDGLGDTKAAARFEREAWLAGRLHHPNIVQVYARGDDGVRPYFAMEYLEGGSLHGAIAEHRQNSAECTSDGNRTRTHARQMAALFEPIADALQHVHEQGVIHRDIKPLNLLFTRDRAQLMLSDFGLARHRDASLNGLKELTELVVKLPVAPYLWPQSGQDRPAAAMAVVWRIPN